MAGPPLNLGGSRVSYAGRSKTVGETKEELLARREKERDERAEARRRLHGAVTVQRIWRGRRDAARWWTGALAGWDRGFGATTAAPTAAACSDRLLPPLLVAGAERAGAMRTLRALALLLASCGTGDGDANWCSLAAASADETRARWVHQARRVTALALDAVSRAEAGTEEEDALASCAARLVSILRAPSAWKFPIPDDEGPPRGGREAAEAAAASLADPRELPGGARLHARVCDALGELTRRDDSVAATRLATTLCAVATDRLFVSAAADESPGVVDRRAASFDEAKAAAVARVMAVPLLHARLPAVTGDDARLALVTTTVTLTPGDSPTADVWTLDNLLGLCTGWRVDGGGVVVAEARRRLAKFAARVGRGSFASAVASLSSTTSSLANGESPGGESPGRSSSVSRAELEARRLGATSCVEETWFALALAGSDAAGVDPSEEGVRAVAGLYWRLLKDAGDLGGGGDSGGGGERGGGISPSDVGTRRLALLGAVAFAPGLAKSLWRSLAASLPASETLPMAVEGPGAGVGAWTSPTLLNGVINVSESDLATVGLFSLAYAHLLLVLDDDEFFIAQRPFTLGEQRGIAACVNTLVVRTHLPGGKNAKGKNNGIAALDPERRTAVRAAVALLKALQTRDARRAFAPPGLWLAPACGSKPAPVAASASALAAHLGVTSGDSTPGDSSPDAAAASSVGAGLLVDCPHALTFDYRVEVFRQLVRDDRARAGYRPQAGGVDASAEENLGQRVRPVADVYVRRGSVLEDATAQILPLGPRARGRLAVRYRNAAGMEEAGIDAGGLFKELLADVCGAGLDPNRGVFASSSTADNYVYPAAAAGDFPEGLLLLELVGMIVGKGLYEGILQEVRLAPFFAKAVLGIPRTLDDLPGLDPELHRSLIQVLRYDGDVADLCLDWTVSEEHLGAVITHELRPDGASKPVTNESKLAYVHAVADFHLDRRRRDSNAAFTRGLAHIIPRGWLKLFGVNELSQLIGGADDGDVDVDDLRRHAAYSGAFILIFVCTGNSTDRRGFLFHRRVHRGQPSRGHVLGRVKAQVRRERTPGAAQVRDELVEAARAGFPSPAPSVYDTQGSARRRRGGRGGVVRFGDLLRVRGRHGTAPVRVHVFQRAQAAELSKVEHDAGEGAVRGDERRGVRAELRGAGGELGKFSQLGILGYGFSPNTRAYSVTRPHESRNATPAPRAPRPRTPQTGAGCSRARTAPTCGFAVTVWNARPTKAHARRPIALTNRAPR